MTIMARLVVILGATLAAASAMALEGARVANNEPHAVQRGLQTKTQDDSGMQALCREILVDTDEGYGVTNHEARVICEQLR